jgi:hypothetical protein
VQQDGTNSPDGALLLPPTSIGASSFAGRGFNRASLKQDMTVIEDVQKSC